MTDRRKVKMQKISQSDRQRGGRTKIVLLIFAKLPLSLSLRGVSIVQTEYYFSLNFVEMNINLI